MFCPSGSMRARHYSISRNAEQGHRVLANKMKEVPQAVLMEHGSGGLGGLNGLNGANPLDPQSIQTSNTQKIALL
jgi:hypothetical protein